VAVKTSTRKRVNGRKRVSKQNNLINVDRAVNTLKSTTSKTLSSFLTSYQAVSIFMFSMGSLVTLSIFKKGGPIGEVILNVLVWCFGYAVYALPVFFFYGVALLIKDSDSVIPQKVLTGTIFVQITSAMAFHSLIHESPIPATSGTDLVTQSGWICISIFYLSNVQLTRSGNDPYSHIVIINKISFVYDKY